MERRARRGGGVGVWTVGFEIYSETGRQLWQGIRRARGIRPCTRRKIRTSPTTTTIPPRRRRRRRDRSARGTGSASARLTTAAVGDGEGRASRGDGTAAAAAAREPPEGRGSRGYTRPRRCLPPPPPRGRCSRRKYDDDETKRRRRTRAGTATCARGHRRSGTSRGWTPNPSHRR